MAYRTAFWLLVCAIALNVLFDPLGTAPPLELKEAAHQFPAFASLSAHLSSESLDSLSSANASSGDYVHSPSTVQLLVAHLRALSAQYAHEYGLKFYVVLLLILTAPFTVPALYTHFFTPFRVEKTIEMTERGIEGKTYPGSRPRRQKGQIPPPFPNAWFKVINSRELERGQVRDVELLGQYFVLYRGKNDGQVRMLDAYCPHMGANLGVMGQVEGDEIVCPFHGWQFNGEGKCTRIPYAERVPSFARTNAWHVMERNGAIMVWHDAEGREPMWFPPEIKEITDGSYRFHGETTHVVRAHVQEMPENGADTAHLNFLHTPFMMDNPLLRKCFKHVWSATWEPGEGIESHLAHIVVNQGVTFCGYKVPGTFLSVNITQVGPGMVHLNFKTPLGSIIVIETVTPIQPLLQRATHQCFADWRCPRWFAKFVLKNMLAQFERDVPIWNNKLFVHNPMVVREDGPILKYRRWFAKNFYSENSEKVARERVAAMVGHTDW